MDVYVSSTAVAAPWQRRLLDTHELARLDGFLRREDRDRFLVGAALLRLVAAERVGIPPATLRIDRTCDGCAKPHGKPRIESDAVHASVSHSGIHVLVAMSADAPVGVDIESTTDPGYEDHQQLHRVLLSPQEESPRTRLEFLRVWTRKEALLKLSGTGLRTSPTLISLTSGGSPRLLGAPRELRDAVVDDLDVAESAVAALATFGAPVGIDVVDAEDRLTH